MIDNITDKLHKFDTSKARTIFEYVATICLMLVLAVLIFSVFFLAFSPLCAFAADYDSTMILKAGTYRFNDVVTFNSEYATALIDYTITSDDGEVGTLTAMAFMYSDNIGKIVYGGTGITDIFVYSSNSGWQGSAFGTSNESLQNVTIINDTVVEEDFATQFISNTNYNEVNGGSPSVCPTLEEQIAQYSGSWVQFINMVRQNNPTLGNSYQHVVNEAIAAGKISVQGDFINFSGTYDELLQLLMTTSNSNPNIQAVLDKELQRQLEIGYQNGFSSALSGNSVEDPIDQYWNSTKDYILIAGQPYFTPNGFGSIDPYNTIGIYGEHESKLHRLDGSTQTFNGQYVTEFASTGTLGGGWYKLGATVGDEYAYEQTLSPTVGDKAYYVARVSPLGDPVEEFLVAIWVDGYEAWYVAEEYAHYGTAANNNTSYKQVYSIYMTDISPTSQRFVNYDNPLLYETFNEDINATLYLATFNQLNNYNVYTDGIGIVEAYNNGYDTGANTTLWLNLISQPIVAFFSIPLAQVIVEGVTYTLTYGVVLGAGIVALVVIWFLKLFAGG